MNVSVPYGDYNMLGTIGTGSTGKVKLAEHKVTGAKVAIKIIKKAKFNQQPDLEKKIKHEIAIMKLFDNSHLLQFINVCESKSHLFIITEYAPNKELFDYLVERGNLEVSEAMKFFRQIIYGLEFLHDHSICHCNLKPENILLDEHNNVKISDFGFARWIKTKITGTFCGSPHYLSPEVLKRKPYDGRKLDIWSSGVILYALLGRLPFEDTSLHNLLHKIVSCEYEIPQNLPDDVKDLISKILTEDPAKRITLKEIKAHPAFRRDIPESYTLPSPLPIPTLTNPIDPASLDKETIDILHQLGMTSDEELSRELLSDQSTMSKVFVTMLTNRLSFDNLPWSLRNTDEIEQDFEASEITVEDQMGLDVTSSASLHTSDPFYRNHKHTSQCSPEFYSVIEQSFLPEEAPSIQCNEHYTIKEIRVSIESLMCAVQLYLNRNGFAWFYPDETKIMTRKESVLDLILQADYDIDDSLKLTVSLIAGGQDEFYGFVEKIQSVIEGIIL
ncbi:CAMK family protein kinase [Histomonas meleagridis]|uniref:CAMK family protein kinase n=1 Tax=Histomonas meleagridis TaxID=135588 RepID=UPI003559ECC0|nr:CAMK family protein kinase [Histomonas meleagridis]KAH0805998.1 CAMK family protein kinase [Histomonas meleagridis]